MVLQTHILSINDNYYLIEITIIVIFFLRLKIFPSFNLCILPDQEVLASPCLTLGKEIDGIRNLAAVNADDAFSYWKSPTNPNFASLEILST